MQKLKLNNSMSKLLQKYLIDESWQTFLGTWYGSQRQIVFIDNGNLNSFL